MLLNLGPSGGFDITPWVDRVRYFQGACNSTWELPVIGAVEEPAAVLIRPDGHVAWVGRAGAPDLSSVMETWFGAPASA